MPSIKIITLGCSKNTVDSEVLMGNLRSHGYTLLPEDAPQSDVLLINTCGFIGDAKEQSVDVILQAIALKQKKRLQTLIVMGCLVQRYADDLSKELPEVDAWYGVHDMPKIIQFLSGKQQWLLSDRVLTTPSHYAYLKIAEGCDRVCSFCAIPLIRGRHISRPMEELVSEAEQLVAQGVKELILISQDLTYYGVDLYKKRVLATLIQKLSVIEGLEWIRLHYLYPHAFPEDLLDEMQSNPKVCKYIDIPLQHISTSVLQSMKRSTTKEQTLDLLSDIRRKLPDASIRTTMIVGYPNETVEAFEELKQFVSDMRFDRMGVFTYSEEEGTSAALLDDLVDEKEKFRRHKELMHIQQTISYQNNQRLLGKTFKVLIDEESDTYYIGRTEFDSPEVDLQVKIAKIRVLQVGSFYDVKIVKAEEYDLTGELV